MFLGWILDPDSVGEIHLTLVCLVKIHAWIRDPIGERGIRWILCLVWILSWIQGPSGGRRPHRVRGVGQGPRLVLFLAVV